MPSQPLLVEDVPAEHVAVAIWSTEDVKERAKERKIKITEKQAEELIDRIDRKQDATIGISWDTIDCYLGDLDNPQ
jgi:hypothetical protein